MARRIPDVHVIYKKPKYRVVEENNTPCLNFAGMDADSGGHERESDALRQASTLNALRRRIKGRSEK